MVNRLTFIGLRPSHLKVVKFRNTGTIQFMDYFCVDACFYVKVSCKNLTWNVLGFGRGGWYQRKWWANSDEPMAHHWRSGNDSLPSQ